MSLTFLAHLSTTCLVRAFRVVLFLSPVVRRPSSTISLNNFSSQSLGRFGPNLAGMLLFFSGTAGPILKKIHRNVHWMTLFKNCLRNFDLYINLALVNGGFLRYMDMKKFLKNLLWNGWSNFEIISQECSFGDPFKKLFAKFWSIQNMALVNGGFLHYTDMKKFLNLLLFNRWSDFEIISQECSFGDPF